MKNFSKTSFYETNFAFKTTNHFHSYFRGSLFCEIPKASSLFKEWIVTERLITKQSSSLEIEKWLNNLVKIFEEEKKTIDEKLQSVENVSAIYSSKNPEITILQCANEAGVVYTLPDGYHEANVTSKNCSFQEGIVGSHEVK